MSDEQQQARSQDVGDAKPTPADEREAANARLDTGRLLGSAAILNALTVTLIGTAAMVYSKWPDGQESIRFHGMIAAVVALLFILTNFQTVRDPASRRSWTMPLHLLFIVAGCAVLYYLVAPTLYVGIGLPLVSVVFQILHRPPPAPAT